MKKMKLGKNMEKSGEFENMNFHYRILLGIFLQVFRF